MTVARPFAYIGADVPRELIEAAGFTPVRLSGAGATARSDLPANFSGRARSLTDQLLSGDFAGCAIGHGGVEDFQLFASLRELDRNGLSCGFPILFVDLLHQAGAPVFAYNLARLRQFKTALESLTGAGVTDNALAEVISASNRLRASLLTTFERRTAPTPTLSGVDALNLLRDMGGLTVVDAERRLAATPAAPSLGGKRLLVTGSPHEADAVYRLLEAAGAVIVGEDHDWGDLWLDSDLDDTLPPLDALAARPQKRPSANPSAPSAARAQALARRAAALRVDGVVHIRLDGDEAPPWDLKATRDALGEAGIPVLALTTVSVPTGGQAADLAARVAAFLSGEAFEEPARPAGRPAAPPPARPKGDDAGRRSRKSLACTRDFSEWQRAWFADVRRRASQGPFAVVNADAPQEVLRAFDVPYVVNQWWAAIVAAKQKTRDYAGLLRTAGYPPNVESYSAQGLAAALDTDVENAPWGGLPKPDLLGVVTNSDAGPKLFEAWASETGARLDRFARSVESRWDIPIDWWDEVPARWQTSLEPERLDLMAAQIDQHIASVEDLTGGSFDRARLVEVMRLVNEQEEYYRRTRDLVAATVPAPISIVDSMPATMTPQWHRGSEWGRDAAKRLYEEVAARVEAGEAACPDEKLRLLWVGRGLWGDMGFYQRWEESHGAVFICSMYLSLAADGYIREFEGEHDVVRALAARFLTMGDELRMPTWAGAWYLKEARKHGVHGAVAIDDADPFVIETLRRAGVPVCQVEMNNMSANGEAAEAQITTFLDGLTASNRTD
jgi:benzoyl-CoA reductase/2-hydroxyglutaryl-CoA dehydratase subunit BcrC/BadD/HgdB